MSDTGQVGKQIEISIEGQLGVIILNRPEAINALSFDMILGITRQLEAWRNDEAVRAVLFEGRGRGFCAGGDVRAARAMILEGRLDEAIAFFATEYRMNALLAGYGKPVIAIGHGIVMGGGIGIAGHADFRLATPNAKFAMPEAAIGFIPDVGVNAILSRAPEHRALYFMMTGTPVGAADALALGLTDCVVPAERLGEIRLGLGDAAGATNVETALVALMNRFTIDPGDATLCAEADLFASELGHDRSARDIVAAVTGASAAYPHVAVASRILALRCPTSLEAIVQGHRAARLLNDIDQVLELDLRLASYMSARPDFAEGVRAVLVDKDNNAHWSPADFASVARDEIAGIVAPKAPDAWARPAAPLSTS